jgi:ubiquinone/menaquinone biosynthesis C-methylase UbiE
MPAGRAVLGLFCDLTLAAGLGTTVGDIGGGTGRLAPCLAARGLSPQGVDLSPGMIRVARRDQPGFDFGVADLRALPFADASLVGVVCWYSLMYLAPPDRPAAFGELARVVKPGGYLVTAFKAGDSQVRRGGRSTALPPVSSRSQCLLSRAIMPPALLPETPRRRIGRGVWLRSARPASAPGRLRRGAAS